MHANLVKPLLFLFDSSWLILPIFPFATYLQHPQSTGTSSESVKPNTTGSAHCFVSEFALGFLPLFCFVSVFACFDSLSHSVT